MRDYINKKKCFICNKFDVKPNLVKEVSIMSKGCFDDMPDSKKRTLDVIVVDPVMYQADSKAIRIYKHKSC